MYQYIAKSFQHIQPSGFYLKREFERIFLSVFFDFQQQRRYYLFVTIHVTGPNSYISIELSKSDRENNLTIIDSIEHIEPNHKSNIIISGNLSANSFEKGKYGLFINATNLSLGYYELNVTRPKNVKTAIKGFYLLNDSKSNFN